MAVIRSVTSGSKAVRAHDTTADLTYQTVVASDGETMFHIASYGSDARKEVGKTSQSMQFSRERAVELVVALRETFPGI